MYLLFLLDKIHVAYMDNINSQQYMTILHMLIHMLLYDLYGM